MTTEKKRDSIFCGLAFFSAVAIGSVSFGYELQSSYFPRLLSIFLGALAIGLWVRVLKLESAGPNLKLSEDVRAQLWGFAKILGAVLIYILAIQLTNYAVATLLFLIVMMGLLGERNFARMALVAAAVTGALYYLFFIFLGVTPPEGLVIFS
ncbi:tripartite tricarboxylate transporter TctB family protein [Rhodobacteraceae bacterium RKSG542]|uniref:tripartite tricarboxylate transporter TctB family protein n=1 Tax=Pseudovibrio flavus TaxID=2529854 RepID=UPI0012BBECF8|nr:tripartite tricarboxylate transporter TctB family protein [Pseudovibrio flavus]MTI18171.1 tripartite tricarboxylate transporter TctB family protein [Pseudovibrio flavus]